MTSNINILLAVVAQYFIPRCLCQYDWRGGDWVMENLKATREAYGVSGEWADYVQTLAETYDEKNYFKSTEEEFITREYGAADWWALTEGEIPYFAVLYRKDRGPSSVYKNLFEGEPDPLDSHVEHHTACGGALITPRYVLTVCGCVMSMWTEIFKFPVNQLNKFADFDIVDNPSEGQEIFVTYSAVQFRPDFKHEVIQDHESWPRIFHCASIIARTDDYGKKSALVNSALLLVPFTPEVTPRSFPFFPHWPPKPVNLKTDPSFSKNVELISIGMRFAIPPDHVFFSSTSASAVKMKHCRPVNTMTCNFTRVRQSEDYTCFCAHSAVHNLHGGVIGWPIVVNDVLVGLSASPKDPWESILAAAILSDAMIARLERVLDKDSLLQQNTPPPVYRHRDLDKKFFIYDYNQKRSVIPFSKATSVRPVGLLLFIAWIITLRKSH